MTFNKPDPTAALRHAIAQMTAQIADPLCARVIIMKSDAGALLTAAKLAQLPTDENALSVRLLAAEDRAAYWERRYRETAFALSQLDGSAESNSGDIGWTKDT